MCTLTFVPHKNRYLLAMNRDESVARPLALPPQVFWLRSGLRAAYPHESSGGTWVAVNEAGVALALLNRYLEGTQPPKKRSRGELIPWLVASTSMGAVRRSLRSLSCDGMLPFRLVAVDPGCRCLLEVAWNGVSLACSELPWELRHWFSSGLSDELASRYRGAVSRLAGRAPDAGSAPWVRTLHGSHAPSHGAFSFCVHRPGVRSVSYTEIEGAKSCVLLRYRPGAPCLPAATTEVALRRCELSLPRGPLVQSLTT
jgi:transport and Golgi organization protein 2